MIDTTPKMEKKRKLNHSEEDFNESIKTKKIKKKDKVKNDIETNTDNEEVKNKKTKKIKEIVPDDNESIELKKKSKNKEKIIESTPTYENSNEEINTPVISTTKKPPRNPGETKKQYKRRMRLLRESGELVDPIPDEGVKKDKKNRKSRKEKRMAVEKKTEELDKYRNIIQLNYLNTWKNDQTKWKFNKNVQGKLIKNMFVETKIPNDSFMVLVEYICESKSSKLHDEITKKCSQIIEDMEKWSSATDEEKKKLKEPDSLHYERAREILQSLA